MNEQAEREQMIAMVDAAMLATRNILPKILRSQCEQIIRAAIQAIAPVPAVPERSLALNAALEYVGRHTPHLVYSEIAAALAAPQPAQQVAHKPLFAELIAKHPGLREELLQQVEKPTIPAPPECKTEAERTAYAFGWFQALATERNRAATQKEPAQDEPVAWLDEDMDCAYTSSELDGGHVHGLIPLYTRQQEPAYAEAVSLATALFKKHFAHEEHYASGHVVWVPCDTTAGVISQIDNMVSGLVQPTTESKSNHQRKDHAND
jgi:hypothetical protein